MVDDEVLKLSEAAVRCGVPLEILKHLIEDGRLPAVRSQRGHAYLHPEAVPSWTGVRKLVEEQLRAHLKEAQDAHKRAMEEVEAVGLDIQEALEHPEQSLGDDLAGLDVAGGRGFSSNPMMAALLRLQFATHPVRMYHQFLRQMNSV